MQQSEPKPRRACPPLHACTWEDIRKSCGWVLVQWREKKLVECRYPWCSCARVVALEDKVTVASE